MERLQRAVAGAISGEPLASIPMRGNNRRQELALKDYAQKHPGSDYRWLLPLSFLAGAAFLTIADLISRLALAPAEIPIGVVTAFVGVPLFLVLLRRDLTR